VPADARRSPAGGDRRARRAPNRIDDPARLRSLSDDVCAGGGRDMDVLTSMRVFVRVVDVGSFARASEKMDVSRASVTKHVAQLEAHLGSRLLQRTTRRLSLTEAGRSYYERCAQILRDVEEAEATVTHQRVEPRGTLRINCAHSFGALYLGPVLAEYAGRFPGVALDVVLADRVVDMVDEGFDLAVRIGQLRDSNLVGRRLATTRMTAVASPAYLAKHGVPAAPVDLQRHDCLGYTYWSTNDIWHFEDADGRGVIAHTKPRIRANNGDVLAAAAIAGAGVALQPTFIVQPAIATGRLAAILTDYRAVELGIFAVYPSRQFLPAKVKTFVDLLASYCAHNAPWESAADCSGVIPPRARRPRPAASSVRSR
jgi:DNA-binding transcriptional LysR family regulator